MPVAKIGDITLSYEVHGKGQPLILITGFASAGGRPLQDVLFGLVEAATPGWNRSKPDLASANLQKFMVALASRSFNGAMYQLLVMPMVKLQAALGKVKAPVGQLKAMLSHNAVERLDKIQAPTIVLTGSQDRLMPPHSAEGLASRTKGAKLVVIDGGAHALGGERFNKEVLIFLNGG